MIVSTYLCDPLERLRGQLGAVEAEKANSTLRRNTDHEELVVFCGLNLTDRVISIGCAFLTKIHLSCLILIVDIDEDFVVA